MHSRVGTKPVIYGEEVRPQHFGSQADELSVILFGELKAFRCES